MTLPVSGAISFNSINTELGLTPTAQISLNDAAIRTLLKRTSGAIAISDAYGKTNTTNTTNTMTVGSSGTGAYGYDTGNVGTFGVMSPNTVTVHGSSQVISGFIRDTTNNTIWIFFDWSYTTPGNMFVTYNGTKYTFIQDSGIPGFFLYSGSIPGLFDNGQLRSFAITTS